MDLLGERLDAIYEGQRKVLLVGWSLGGMFARRAGLPLPGEGPRGGDLGSPFSGDLKTNTNVREFYERIAGPRRQPAAVRAHSTGKPPVPTLALWSRRDGIVAPERRPGPRP